MTDLSGRPLAGQPALAASPSSPVPGLAPAGFDQAYEGSLRVWANVLDSLTRETDDDRWLRNAAQWLRDNPDTSEEPK